MHVIKENAKALIALLTALGTWGATASAEEGISGQEWFGLCGVLVAGLAVWAVSNAPSEAQLEELAAWKDE